MEKIIERLGMARKALTALQEALTIPNPSLLERDGIIQRFEFTYEAVWKAAQSYLREVEKIDVASPKGIVRGSFKSGLFDEAMADELLRMSDARNMTVHTYNEELAMLIYQQIGRYAFFLEMWLAAMEKNYSE
jgi:nucleotidyltransferase substrate binding protein (TIGR01987 family)